MDADQAEWIRAALEKATEELAKVRSEVALYVEGAPSLLAGQLDSIELRLAEIERCLKA